LLRAAGFPAGLEDDLALEAEAPERGELFPTGGFPLGGADRLAGLAEVFLEVLLELRVAIWR
jgi:hypothetical protein